MKQKPMIVYTKTNGKQKRKTINIFNRHRILRKIYKKDTWNLGGFIFYIYRFNKDVEYVRFENFKFNRISGILTEKNTRCIFENCTFKNPKRNDDKSINLNGGSFEIINPTLINIKEFFPEGDSDVYGIENLSINITNNNEEMIEQLEEPDKMEKGYSETIGGYSKKVSLNGNFKLQYVRLHGKNITIGNRKTPTSIITKPDVLSIEAKEKLELTNCTLDSTQDNYCFATVHLKAPNLEIENVTLKSNKDIRINNYTYHKKEETTELVVTDKDIIRTKLISALKGYNEFLKKQIEEKSQEYINDSFPDAQKDIKEKQEAITNEKLRLSEQQSELSGLENELEKKRNEKRDTIIKSLTRKPINELKK